MPVFEIIEAQPHHCGQIVRRLRHDYHSACLALGLNPHKELRACFDASYLRRAWLIDGKLEGVGGVYGGALSSAGYIWLALSEQTRRYPLAMLKEARRQIADVAATKHHIGATTLRGDASAARFIERLGFTSLQFSDAATVWQLQRYKMTREAA